MKNASVLTLMLSTLLQVSCTRDAQEGAVQEFHKAEVGTTTEGQAAQLQATVEALALAVNIPLAKISDGSTQLTGAPLRDGSRATAIGVDLKFVGLSAEEFARLQGFLNSWVAVPNTLAYRADVSLGELLPPVPQALLGHWFQEQKITEGDLEALSTLNCWTTAYEVLRLSRETQLEFNAFYTDGEPMEALFKESTLFEEVSSLIARDETVFQEIIKTARPGDLINFGGGNSIRHSAIVVGPGLLFEKTNPFSASFFRLTTVKAASDLFEASKIQILRLRSQAKLKAPGEIFADGIRGGNSIFFAEGTRLALINPLGPITDDDHDGRWTLPAEAFVNTTYGYRDLPNRPLVPIQGDWYAPVELKCVTTREVSAQEHPWSHPAELGRIAAGTEFRAVNRTLSYLEAATIVNTDGEILSGRALRHPWLPEDAVKCEAP